MSPVEQSNNDNENVEKKQQITSQTMINRNNQQINEESEKKIKQNNEQLDHKEVKEKCEAEAPQLLSIDTKNITLRSSKRKDSIDTKNVTLRKSQKKVTFDDSTLPHNYSDIFETTVSNKKTFSTKMDNFDNSKNNSSLKKRSGIKPEVKVRSTPTTAKKRIDFSDAVHQKSDVFVSKRNRTLI